MTPDGKRFFQNCDYVHKVAEDVIEKRKRGLEKEGVPKVRHMDFLDILLLAKDEDGHAMTSQEIRSQVDSFMAAGHETTAAASPWFMHDLTSSPEWTDKCREEVDAILAGRDSDHILWSDLPGLQNLNLCFKESLRLHPTIPEIARELNEDMEIDGHIIPAGTPIHVTIMNLHMNHLIWDKPEEFNPDRMREENLKKIDNFAFAPFSAGPRNCIGKHFATNEMKTLLARILHRYILTIPPEAPAPDRKIETVLRSKDGLWFTIKRR